MIKKILINIMINFGLCFVIHNIYKWFPNNLSAIFFPVNESIWEHMKMLFTCFLITGLINYFIFNKHNLAISSFITGIASIIFYLVLFLPFNSENKILIFSILILDIIIFEYVRYLIIHNHKFNKYNKLAYIFIIVTYIVFGYLTFNPLKIDLFKDTIENKYGINTYII